MPVSYAVEDRRTVTCPIPANNAETEQFGKFIVNAAQDGYVLKAGGTMEGGHQRDPYVIGVRLVFEKAKA